MYCHLHQIYRYFLCFVNCCTGLFVCLFISRMSLVFLRKGKIRKKTKNKNKTKKKKTSKKQDKTKQNKTPERTEMERNAGNFLYELTILV